MLFSSLLIMGSILYASNKVRKKSKKKSKKITITKKNNLIISPDSDGSKETDISDIETWVNRSFLVASVALGSALAGVWIPALAVFSSVTLLLLTLPILWRSYQGLVKQHRFKVDIISVIVLPLLILSGYLPAAAIGYWLYYLGLKFLAKAKKKSEVKLTNILSDQLQTVWIQRDNCEIEIDFKDLRLNDIVVVQGGEIIPVDGSITEGMASINQGMMTGEAQPVEKNIHDSVFAFTIVLTGKIWIKVEKTGAETVASEIDKILTQTTNFAGSVELKVEKMADRLTLPTLALGAFTFSTVGYTSALVVLDSALLESMYITGTLGVLSHLSLASDYKILIKDGRALEALKNVDTIVFDKTGTLTEEIPHVGKIYASKNFSETEVLLYAATGEYKQTHPIAKAILQAVQQQELTLPTVDDTQYEIGYGVKITLDKQIIRVGSARFMVLENIPILAEIETIQHHASQEGYSLVYVAVDQQLAGVIELHPTIRPEAKELIKQLKQRKLSLYILSGDQKQPTQALANELGIENYFAETLPQDKAEIISQLQQEGKLVCFVGDGINDSIALKQADVSISFNNASSVASDTAQIVLMDDSLQNFIKLFELSTSLEKNFKKSLLWDVIPNVINIGGTYFFHLGIYGALSIYSIGLVGGLINGLLPIIKADKKSGIVHKLVNTYTQTASNSR